ncbi:MAG: SDR family NAD(P)-dependent oxidoreductase [Eubacteriales bacterium]|nr:SDR family NAD(P)-dependent oxidoreductase [Eubacteriales bacterium]
MKQTVWITGATSGIGKAFARQYAASGCRLILTARNEEQLKALASELSVPCTLLPGDLTDAAVRRQMLRRFRKQTSDIPLPVPDIFINNAGMGVCGRFTDTDTDRELMLIRLNVEAMHHLFKESLKLMEKRGSGTILNVGSSAGLLPAGPYMAAYYASKSYVVSLTRAAARELREKHSRVYTAVLCPGPVDTEFNTRAGAVSALKGITPEFCVTEACKGMKKKKTVIVPSAFMRFCTHAQVLLPDSLLIPITGHQQKKKMR